MGSIADINFERLTSTSHKVETIKARMHLIYLWCLTTIRTNF